MGFAMHPGPLAHNKDNVNKSKFQTENTKIIK
jgi:hypothetical protein